MKTNILTKFRVYNSFSQITTTWFRFVFVNYDNVVCIRFRKLRQRGSFLTAYSFFIAYENVFRFTFSIRLGLWLRVLV